MTPDADTVVQDLHHPLILSSRVIGTPVFDRSGTRLGHIEELSLEKKSGKAVYAIMSFGGFLGIGEKFHPVPWMLLDYDSELGGYTVPLDPAALKDAPSYGIREIRDLGGPEYRAYGDTIYGFYGTYGVTPYW